MITLHATKTWKKLLLKTDVTQDSYNFLIEGTDITLSVENSKGQIIAASDFIAGEAIIHLETTLDVDLSSANDMLNFTFHPKLSWTKDNPDD